MGGKVIDFGDKKINKIGFYRSKKLFKINNIDINKILISKAESYGQKNVKKYITGYSDNIIRPLLIKLPQMIGYLNSFEDNKSTVLFLVDDEEFLKKYIDV